MFTALVSLPASEDSPESLLVTWPLNFRQLELGLSASGMIHRTVSSLPPSRSPWSNKYDPPLEDGAMPSARLRKLEVEANNAFDQYRDL